MSDIGKLSSLSPTPQVSTPKRTAPTQEAALPKDTLTSAEPAPPDAKLRHLSFTAARTGQAATEANLALGQGWNDFLNGPSKASVPTPEQRASAAYDSQRDGLIAP